jgi:hypothetical protein
LIFIEAIPIKWTVFILFDVESTENMPGRRDKSPSTTKL